MQRDFKGIWIPAEIWLNTELSLLEKVMFAEIDSLDGEDGCYATNDYFMKFFNVSESSITRSIATLKRLGYIESEQIGGRSRVLRVVKMTTKGSQIDYSGSSICENLLYKEKKIIENNREAPAPVPAQTSTKRNFRRTFETLTDDLESGRVIDDEKKEKKKKSNYEKCLDELSSRNFSDDVKELLEKHLQWSYNSKDPKRIRDRSTYKSKLNFLEQLQKKGEDLKRVVQQSIDREWHAFYEYKKDETIKNVFAPTSKKLGRTDVEEAHRILEERRADPNTEWY